MKFRIIHFLPAIAWFILIYVLLTLPGSDIPKDPLFEIIYFDKWVHIGLFAGLVFLFCRPFRKVLAAKHPVFMIIIGLCILYGVAMEYVQEYFTEGRSFDVTDMLADSVGCIAGYLLYRWIEKANRKEKNKPL